MIAPRATLFEDKNDLNKYLVVDLHIYNVKEVTDESDLKEIASELLKSLEIDLTTDNLEQVNKLGTGNLW